MTYEEFKTIIESVSDYCVDKENGGITIGTADYDIAWINNEKNYTINTAYYKTDEDECFIANHWNTISDFVATHPKERMQEKKYYIKLKLPDIINDANTLVDEYTFLNVATNTKTGYVENILSDRFCVIRPNVEWKTQFTNQEFEEIIPKEHRSSFVLVPVEEEA